MKSRELKALWLLLVTQSEGGGLVRLSLACVHIRVRTFSVSYHNPSVADRRALLLRSHTLSVLPFERPRISLLNQHIIRDEMYPNAWLLTWTDSRFSSASPLHTLLMCSEWKVHCSWFSTSFFFFSTSYASIAICAHWTSCRLHSQYHPCSCAAACQKENLCIWLSLPSPIEALVAYLSQPTHLSICSIWKI